MQDQHARLNAVIFRRRHSDRAHSTRLVVLLYPAVHMLIHERPHLCWPSFHARAGGLADLQGDDELRAVAVGDIEDPGFPRVQRSGVAGDVFVVARLSSGRVVGAMYEGSTVR